MIGKNAGADLAASVGEWTRQGRPLELAHTLVASLALACGPSPLAGLKSVRLQLSVNDDPVPSYLASVQGTSGVD